MARHLKRRLVQQYSDINVTLVYYARNEASFRAAKLAS